MVDNEVHEAGDDIPDDVTAEPGFGTVWALLWLIMKAERQAVALAIIGDKNNDAAGAESLKKWAEPQLVAYKRAEDVAMIRWRRVVRILRNQLPLARG
jgi:hypothetical protein